MQDQSPTEISPQSKTVMILIVGVWLLGFVTSITIVVLMLLTQEPNLDVLTTWLIGMALFQIRASRFLFKYGENILVCQNLKIVILRISVELLTFVSYLAVIALFFLTQEPNFYVLISLCLGTALFYLFVTRYLDNNDENILDRQNLKIVLLKSSVEILAWVSYFAVILWYILTQGPNFYVLVPLCIGIAMFHLFVTRYLNKKLKNLRIS
ncbi:MAG: hypothetical protein P1V19_11150 [Gimesia sp.]|nr:hypothetical protein [Gimesia sp.]